MNPGKLKVLVLIFALIAGPAFAQSIGEKTGANAILGITPKTADFVKEAAEDVLYEIQSSELAASKTDRRVKEFATKMVANYMLSLNELRNLAQKAGVVLPTEISSAQQHMLSKLSALTGDDFMQRYLDDQIIAQKAAISVFERYGKGGADAELKSWAKQTLAALQRDLDMAKALDLAPN
jgi:putative membrane protein